MESIYTHVALFILLISILMIKRNDTVDLLLTIAQYKRVVPGSKTRNTLLYWRKRYQSKPTMCISETAIVLVGREK